MPHVRATGPQVWAVCFPSCTWYILEVVLNPRLLMFHVMTIAPEDGWELFSLIPEKPGRDVITLQREITLEQL